MKNIANELTESHLEVAHDLADLRRALDNRSDSKSSLKQLNQLEHSLLAHCLVQERVVAAASAIVGDTPNEASRLIGHGVELLQRLAAIRTRLNEEGPHSERIRVDVAALDEEFERSTAAQWDFLRRYAGVTFTSFGGGG